MRKQDTIQLLRDKKIECEEIIKTLKNHQDFLERCRNNGVNYVAYIDKYLTDLMTTIGTASGMATGESSAQKALNLRVLRARSLMDDEYTKVKQEIERIMQYGDEQCETPPPLEQQNRDRDDTAHEEQCETPPPLEQQNRDRDDTAHEEQCNNALAETVNRLQKYMQLRDNDNREFKTHVFGKGVGIHKSVKIEAAQAMINLLKGEDSAFNSDKSGQNREAYTNALCQRGIFKRSELCETMMSSPVNNILKCRNPRDLVRKLVKLANDGDLATSLANITDSHQAVQDTRKPLGQRYDTSHTVSARPV